MSATAPGDFTPVEIHEAIARRMAVFYDQFIKPTARDSAGKAAEPEQDRGDECHCKTPIPKHTSENVHICARCGSVLKVDGEGHPYRRHIGDLDTPEQLAGRRVLEVAETSKLEMAALVAMLPAEKQRRLMKLPNRKFEKVARKMIKVHLAMQAHAAEDQPGPNEQRRRAARARILADVVDARKQKIAMSPNFAATEHPGLDEFMEGLLEHKHGPEHEIISQAEYRRRRDAGEL